MSLTNFVPYFSPISSAHALNASPGGDSAPAPRNHGSHYMSGHVRIWRLESVSLKWQQLGHDIDGERFCAASVALFASCTPKAIFSGRVRTYRSYAIERAP